MNVWNKKTLWFSRLKRVTSWFSPYLAMGQILKKKTETVSWGVDLYTELELMKNVLLIVGWRRMKWRMGSWSNKGTVLREIIVWGLPAFHDLRRTGRHSPSWSAALQITVHCAAHVRGLWQWEAINLICQVGGSDISLDFDNGGL